MGSVFICDRTSSYFSHTSMLLLFHSSAIWSIRSPRTCRALLIRVFLAPVTFTTIMVNWHEFSLRSLMVLCRSRYFRISASDASREWPPFTHLGMTSSMSMLARELNSAYDFSRSSSSPMPCLRTRLTYSRAALTGASSGDTVAMSWLPFDTDVDVLEVMSSIPSTRSHIAS